MNAINLVRALVITTLLVATYSHADTLSDRTITNFIASLEELSTMEDEFEALTEDLDASEAADLSMPDMEHVFSKSLQSIKGHSVYDKLAGVVKRHGFANPDQWAQTGDRIFHAWMALEMENQDPRMAQEMENALAELDNNPNLTAAQKEQFKAMMGGAMSAMAQAGNAPADDVRAVKPHLEALRAATDPEDD
ncbi:hypothetical protein [Marinobacter sp. X15-166B]|uniref:hypothetical protein n=1 Tax=Marinobacter sp. X15-166B TaxID=1897620 RepID=UPI00085C9CBA|nr:hypothetical protein [Marinobacter sp. X15-166B]OEY66228.1 hypothetical protein BG841_07015 [Marinobacter sp. X15-166B]